MSIYNENKNLAEKAAEEGKNAVNNTNKLSNDDMFNLAEVVVNFSEVLTGDKYRSYQKPFALRIAYSLLVQDAKTVTALLARQSGKSHTVAMICSGIVVLVPLFCKYIKDKRIQKFKSGVHVGVFGPTNDTAAPLYLRIKKLMFSDDAIKIVADDPDLAMDLEPYKDRKVITLPNGSFISIVSCGPNSKIEGKTLHLTLTDESQDISNTKYRKSIWPMTTETAGSRICIGTPTYVKNWFYERIQQNKDKDLLLKENNLKSRLHFEHNYIDISAVSENYAQSIEEAIEELGFESEEFRLSYRLEWLLDRGHFMTKEVLDNAAYIKSKDSNNIDKLGHILSSFHCSGKIEQANLDDSCIVAIDIGKSVSSTVVTVGKIWTDAKLYCGPKKAHNLRRRVHIINWLELFGDNHELQYLKIMDFLSNFNVVKVIVDATGKGDPIHERFQAEFEPQGIEVVPFKFSKQSKHDGYTLLYQEISNRRLTWPKAKATYSDKTHNFYTQMLGLEKIWTDSGHMLVQKSADNSKAKDDYPDSVMMLSWLANKEFKHEVEQFDISPYIQTPRRAYIRGNELIGKQVRKKW